MFIVILGKFYFSVVSYLEERLIKKFNFYQILAIKKENGVNTLQS